MPISVELLVSNSVKFRRKTHKIILSIRVEFELKEKGKYEMLERKRNKPISSSFSIFVFVSIFSLEFL